LQWKRNPENLFVFFLVESEFISLSSNRVLVFSFGSIFHRPVLSPADS
jgi:hypothetical protein